MSERINNQGEKVVGNVVTVGSKKPYESPRVQKRSVTRVTLFSGGGVGSIGVTVSG